MGGSLTHNHVFQGVLGEPAVEEHGDEEVSEGRKNHLSGRQEVSVGGSNDRMALPEAGRSLPLTVIMKGTALIISRMKGTRSTCSQTLPWKPGTPGQERDQDQTSSSRSEGEATPPVPAT